VISDVAAISSARPRTGGIDTALRRHGLEGIIPPGSLAAFAVQGGTPS
jgi:hypothetical protein